MAPCWAVRLGSQLELECTDSREGGRGSPYNVVAGFFEKSLKQ